MKIKTLLVGLGVGLGTLAFSQCPVTVTHSGANFTGGSFVMQAGFAEGEAAAATYTLSASEFPIKLNLAEMIFAGQNLSGPTTTVWEVFVYSGTPDTGTLVASEVADDTILPFLRMGPGTVGTNIQFSVDPGDPEQIYVNDDGSHKVTIGFRIVQHNNPPSNPCSASPPTNSNVFPTTDTNGLTVPSGNWIYAIDCGIFGAPAGWSSFASLPSIFRPSGDWNIRFTYESTNPLQITSHPSNVNTTIGSPAVFQVQAAGAGTLAYQWYKGTTAVSNDARHFGATSDSLVIINTIAADAGDYKCVVSSACGSVTSNNGILSFGTQTATLAGNVVLNNWVRGTNNMVLPMQLTAVGSSTVLLNTTITLDAAGNYSFTLPAAIIPGNYDIFVQGSHWLRKIHGNVAISATGASGVNFSLTNGDVDGDNEVGPGDFSVLSGAFGSSLGDGGFLPNADLDGDDEVGPSDFGILSSNFGDSGD